MIWFHLYDLKIMKNTHGGVLLLLKLQEPATLLKETLLYGCFSCFWIVQIVPNHAKHHIYSYISQVYLYNIPMLLRYRAWKVSVFGVTLVRIFPQSDWTRRDREYLSVFRSNAGKCRPEKFRIRTFYAVIGAVVIQKLGWKVRRLIEDLRYMTVKKIK